MGSTPTGAINFMNIITVIFIAIGVYFLLRSLENYSLNKRLEKLTYEYMLRRKARERQDRNE